MVVKNYKMFLGANGELQDTPDDDDPDSPECQFGADMTAHYEELGKHFPIIQGTHITKVFLIELIVQSYIYGTTFRWNFL